MKTIKREQIFNSSSQSFFYSQQNNSKIEELLKKDVHVVDVDFLSNILITILHQTLQCMSDNQWELKRMSKQVSHTICRILDIPT